MSALVIKCSGLCRFALMCCSVSASLIASLIACGSLLRADEATEYFEREVRPVLVAKCAECHAAGEAEGGLAIISQQALLEGGESGPAIDLEQPLESLLLAAVQRTGDVQMPPDAPLRASEIEAIAKWLESGAVWPATPASDVRTSFAITDSDREHWSFRPLASVAAPELTDLAQVKNDVDRFVQAKLLAKGLRAAPEADRRTLIRRLTFDLIGLPPSPAEVDAFVNDPRSTDDVLSEAIDRLLASPRYGERWGRHWLDVARYADTKDGVLMYGDDRIRPFAYTYRDYVIRAFNEDLPFDQFVVDQIAADQVQPAREAWRLGALGLLTLGRMYDNNVHDVIDDQIDVVSRGFLGLTLSCARCHDHKYDPLSTADYYAMYGVFANSEVPLELPRTDNDELAPATAEFETLADEKRQAIAKFMDDQFNLLHQVARDRTAGYLVKAATTPTDPLETAIFFFSLSPDDLRPQIMGRWRQVLSRRAIATDPVFGLWHDLMPLLGTAPGSSVDQPVETAATLGEVFEQHRGRQGTESGLTNPLVFAAVEQAIAHGTLVDRASLAKVYGDLFVKIESESRAADASVNAADPVRVQLLQLLVGAESPITFPRSQTRKYMSRAETDSFGGLLTELDRLATQNSAAAPRAMVVRDRETIQEPRIFQRGNPSNPGETVARRFPELLNVAASSPFSNGSGRLELAHAIVSDQNPLTDRVWVNRVWMHHFGEPLVGSPSDFGSRTELPVQIDLLDDLATKFRQSGRSTKQLHKLILMSHTWRQSSEPSQADRELAQQIDPEVRLLWRSHRRRLDFEAMRDSTLTVAGNLEQRLGGRPVDLAQNPSTPVRTVYGLVDRQNLPGMYRAFDFASPDVSIERRPRTMVAQQTLFALNSPFMLDQASRLAARVAQTTADPSSQVAELTSLAWQREPTNEELEEMTAYLAIPSESETTLGPLDRLALVLLSSNEWMYLD